MKMNHYCQHNPSQKRKIKISIPLLALSFFLVPASTSIYVLSLFDRYIADYAKISIYTSVVCAILGFCFAHLTVKKQLFYKKKVPRILYTRLSYFLIMTSIVALLVNFLRIGSFPLFSGDLARIELQKSPLWNLMVFCTVGLFIFSSVSRQYSDFKFKTGWLLVSVFLLLLLFSGWKGTFLNSVFLTTLPCLKTKKVSIFQLLFFLLLFMVLFFGINYLRSGNRISISLISPVYYIYWGFYNFSDFGNYDFDGIYSIPLLAKKIIVENSLLEDPTWNVFSALTPLYIDGGNLLIAVVFFVVAYVLVWSSKRHNLLEIDFIFYICFYFLFLAHNGYLFTSKCFLIMFLFIVMIHIVTLVQIKDPIMSCPKRGGGRFF